MRRIRSVRSRIRSLAVPSSLALCLLAALSAAAAPAKRQPTTSAPAREQPPAQPAPAKEPPPTAPAPAREPPPAPARETSSSSSSSRDSARLAVALDVFAEGGNLNGEQWINETLRNESFNLGTAALSGSAWLSFRQNERLRLGPGVRAYGFYGSTAGRPFVFGPLFEGFALAEYALPVVEQFEAVFSGRAGLGLLFPAGDLAGEIQRLQRDGVGVWSVPRVGWLGGVGIGTRRRMAERLWLRADLGAQYTQLFLFATDERVDELRFRKGWNTSVLRLSFQLGAEFSL